MRLLFVASVSFVVNLFSYHKGHKGHREEEDLRRSFCPVPFVVKSFSYYKGHEEREGTV